MLNGDEKLLRFFIHCYAKSAMRRRQFAASGQVSLLLTGPDGQPVHCVAVHVIDVPRFRVDVDATVHRDLRR